MRSSRVVSSSTSRAPGAKSPMNPSLRPTPAVGPFLVARRALSRRHFLRGSGIAMALPLLDAMRPAFTRAASGGPGPAARPRRMLAICNNLGLLGDQFFPTGTGRDYAPSPYLEVLQAH